MGGRRKSWCIDCFHQSKRMFKKNLPLFHFQKGTKSPPKWTPFFKSNKNLAKKQKKSKNRKMETNIQERKKSNGHCIKWKGEYSSELIKKKD